jgi:tRNA A37 threonylcarbamoyltransferase TsaD
MTHDAIHAKFKTISEQVILKSKQTSVLVVGGVGTNKKMIH